jgi:hypothetical protein
VSTVMDEHPENFDAGDKLGIWYDVSDAAAA